MVVYRDANAPAPIALLVDNAPRFGSCLAMLRQHVFLSDLEHAVHQVPSVLQPWVSSAHE